MMFNESSAKETLGVHKDESVQIINDLNWYPM